MRLVSPTPCSTPSPSRGVARSSTRPANRAAPSGSVDGGRRRTWIASLVGAVVGGKSSTPPAGSSHVRHSAPDAGARRVSSDHAQPSPCVPALDGGAVQERRLVAKRYAVPGARSSSVASAANVLAVKRGDHAAAVETCSSCMAPASLGPSSVQLTRTLFVPTGVQWIVGGARVSASVRSAAGGSARSWANRCAAARRASASWGERCSEGSLAAV
mmetsp:Transcript_10403/g.24095  ORF Transcript_10403/g.24095 Transcript_10403/m.24095 type:complete len:215 (-) Transcript_10403:157-801(-)